MQRLAVVTISFILNSMVFAQTIESPFPFCQNDDNPIGGGSGYQEMIKSKSIDIIIDKFSSPEDFRDQIQNARNGSVIYIQGDLEIDLTGLTQTITIKENITICSDRGISEGALIKTDDFMFYSNSASGNGKALFTVTGDNVHITGLRFQGPSEEVSTNEKGFMKFKPCFYVMKNDHFELDNCELYGWPYATVRIGGNISQASLEGNKIHHNYIHDNKQNGLGYGVAIDNGYAQVYANIFSRNRHDIAGSGKPACGYEAYCNVITAGGMSHNFDMHAQGTDDMTGNAGRFIYIHHNDFHDIGGPERLLGNNFNIMIRGRPDVQCRIENNRFKHESYGDAIQQRNQIGGFGNLLLFNNIIGSRHFKGWYVYKEWIKKRAPNCLNIPSTAEVLMTGEINEKCSYRYQYSFGDFDGDGKTDIFKLENNNISVLPFDCSSKGNEQEWKLIASTEHNFDQLHMFYFGKDDKTDILVQRNDSLYFSNAGAENWKVIGHLAMDLSDIQLGDFNGDGKTDLITSDGEKIIYSYDYGLAWSEIESDLITDDNFKLGYFDNDKIVDLIFIDRRRNYILYGKTKKILDIDHKLHNLKNLQFGDWNNDGLTDLFYAKDNTVFLTKSDKWLRCNTSNFPLSQLSHFNF